MRRKTGYRLVAGVAAVVATASLVVAATHSRDVEGAPAPQPDARLARVPDCGPVIAGLDLRAQLAQLVVVGVPGSDPASTVKLVQDHQLGGIFIAGDATELLTNQALDAVQKAAKVPVSVAVDEEGGRVQRIDTLDGSIPSARELAATRTPEQVREVAAQRGKQLRARGVTVDYAPDADITDQPAHEAIGDRSFSGDPERARLYVRAFAAGLRDAGVFPVLKHFPGHGHASGDSHTGLVRTPPLPELRRVDLVPYQRITEYGPIGVMVGHLDVPDLTGGLPASLSAPAYQLLRTEFGFTGPVVTDDLGAMKAITEQFPLPEAVLKALQAGADEALWSSGGHVDQVLDRLSQAVRTGELPEPRVRESLTRVLTAKGLCG
ncbi:glycoside hydrolase family 3 N-terminal domain-containing protein [Amycolatopsis sp. NPDC059021]|uniref:glycoside hydrolase family 3 N-terminal domain-containing protein n=1 Tax=Amycolatopsis sp. NPDC059021 TaxID=3346704 RepID=UPI00366BD582